MAAVSYDLHIEQGAVFTASWEWREDNGSNPPAGTLISLADYTPHLEIRTQPGGTLMADFTVGDGLTVTADVITLRIGVDVTETLVENGSYDLELHHNTDDTTVIRLSAGNVLVSLQVTESP